MSDKSQFKKLKDMAKAGIDSIDLDSIKGSAEKTGGALKEFAGKAGVAIKDNASSLRIKLSRPRMRSTRSSLNWIECLKSP